MLTNQNEKYILRKFQNSFQNISATHQMEMLWKTWKIERLSAEEQSCTLLSFSV